MAPRCGACSACRSFTASFTPPGPGHGKAVISSYVIANEETWRRGVELPFASSVLQAAVAVALVTVAAVLLGVTAARMNDAVRVIEIASYALIVAIGLRLTWGKGQGFLSAWQAQRATHAAHDHVHDHHHTRSLTRISTASTASMGMTTRMTTSIAT